MKSVRQHARVRRFPRKPLLLRQLPQVAEQAAEPERLAEERGAEGLQVEELPVGARAGVVVLQEVRPGRVLVVRQRPVREKNRVASGPSRSRRRAR